MTSPTVRLGPDPTPAAIVASRVAISALIAMRPKARARFRAEIEETIVYLERKGAALPLHARDPQRLAEAYSESARVLRELFDIRPSAEVVRLARD